ncbi:MAG: hypothetical protein JWQ81_5893 [Amycolatopsis sp.]|nr:hypothetical protein [Amycolatopsis sp.]
MMIGHQVTVGLAHQRIVVVEISPEPVCVDRYGQRLAIERVCLHQRVALRGDPPASAERVIEIRRTATRHRVEHRAAPADHDVRLRDLVLRV